MLRRDCFGLIGIVDRPERWDKPDSGSRHSAGVATLNNFGRRLLEPMNLALYTGVCWFMFAYTTYSLRPESSDLLPNVVNGWIALMFLGLGIAFGLAAGYLAWRLKDGRVGWVAFLGFAVGGAMTGVVQKEPGSFYAVSVGVFSSLVLALAAVEQRKARRKPGQVSRKRHWSAKRRV